MENVFYYWKIIAGEMETERRNALASFDCISIDMTWLNSVIVLLNVSFFFSKQSFEDPT